MRKKSILILLLMVTALVFILSIEHAYALVYTEGDTFIGTDGTIMSAEEAYQWTYTVSSNKITLTGYTGSIVDGKIVGCMPSTINGNPVTKINSLFSKNTELIEAPIIPLTVTSMQNTFVTVNLPPHCQAHSTYVKITPAIPGKCMRVP